MTADEKKRNWQQESNDEWMQRLNKSIQAISKEIENALTDQTIDSEFVQRTMLNIIDTFATATKQAPFDADGIMQTIGKMSDTEYETRTKDFTDALHKSTETDNTQGNNIQSRISNILQDKKKTYDAIEQYKNAAESLWLLASLSDDMKTLLPFLLEEIENLRKQPSMENLTLREFLQNVDENGEPTESLFSQAIERARQRQNDIDIQNSAADIPTVTAKPIDRVEYPLDKPDSIIWNLLEAADKSGQLQLAFATEKRLSKKEATVVYSINFDELENEVAISKKLTPFDKRVYIAASALFNGDNDIVSVTQILSKMGMTRKPSKRDIAKALESLKKMMAAHIHIDNLSEHETYKNYPKFKYDGVLLPIEIVSAYINGQLTESAVHIFREPPMITFAKGRKQITTILIRLLESPVNKTDQNLMIDDYLIERISRAKRGKAHKVKMLYDTIFKNCNITTAKQKQRAPEKIERYLTHYVKCGFITRYEKAADGIEVHY